jgi:hypothetical protein
MCTPLAKSTETIPHPIESEREKKLKFDGPLNASIAPRAMKLPLERRSISVYHDEQIRCSSFFTELHSISTADDEHLLSKIKMISKEIFRISLGIPRGTFKFRLNFALFQTFSQLKDELTKKSLKDHKSLIKIENFLSIQLKNTNYPSIFTENYILETLRALAKRPLDTPHELFSEVFIKEIYYVRELLIRFNESLKYHTLTEKAIISYHFTDNFFKEYKNLFSAFKAAPLCLNKDEVITKIQRKILKTKERSEIKTLQIDTLRLALLSPNPEPVSKETEDIFNSEVQKMDLLLNPPQSVIHKLINKLEASWLIIKKLSKREIPITFFESSITRINDYFIKNSMPVPKKFLFLQIDISKAGKILRDPTEFII